MNETVCLLRFATGGGEIDRQLTVLCESLDNGSDDHSDGTEHNSPSTTKALIEPWCNWDTNDRPKLIAGRDETEETSRENGLSFVVFSSITEVYSDGQHIVSPIINQNLSADQATGLRGLTTYIYSKAPRTATSQ